MLPVLINSLFLQLGHSFNSCLTWCFIFSSFTGSNLSFLCPSFLPIFSPVFFAKLGITFFLPIGVWLVGIPLVVPSLFWIAFNLSISLCNSLFLFSNSITSASFLSTIFSNLLCSSSAISARNFSNLYLLYNLVYLFSNFS